MSWALIRTQLKTTLQGVAGIGVVHDHQRWVIEAANFKTAFVTGGRINAWMITRYQSTEIEEAAQQNYRTHQVRIIGIYALDDSDGTEKVFSDLLEDICDTLRADNTLNGTAESSTPPQVTSDAHTKFGGASCHYGEITLGIREDRTF